MFRKRSFHLISLLLGALVLTLLPSTAFAKTGADVTAKSTILTWITFLPFIGAMVILVLPKRFEHLYKQIALVASILPLVLAIQMALGFNADVVASGAAGTAPQLQDYTVYGLQYVHHMAWIPSLGVEYFVGVDGISVVMVVLSALISFIAILASYLVNTPVNLEKGYRSGIAYQQKGYYCLILMLATGMMGVFVALDLFLFYVFWEIMLLPMYFLIGIWGGPRKEYAAIKFFLYTLAGSLAMLVAFIYIYYNSAPLGGAETFPMVNGETTEHTFNIMFLSFSSTTGWGSFFTQNLAWVLLFVGFAIKVPMFPFHTWLPDAHVEAPTPISVILAGVLLKMGTYGMLRFNWQMLPEATLHYSTVVVVFGLIGILWGAYCAMAQTDFKRLIAYSSVSHMGFVLLGMGSLTSEGINGAVFQMFSHGLVTGMLFLLVGILYDRAHHRNVDGFGGIAKVVPVYTGFIGLAFMASLGLPGLSGFIGEVMVFIGAFQRHPVITVFAVTSVIITAGYMLWTAQRIFLGPLNEKYSDLSDMNWREWATLVPLGIPVIVFGVYPGPILDMFSGALTTLNKLVLTTAVVN